MSKATIVILSEAKDPVGSLQSEHGGILRRVAPLDDGGVFLQVSDKKVNRI